jgi:hypothetical protein
LTLPRREEYIPGTLMEFFEIRDRCQKLERRLDSLRGHL